MIIEERAYARAGLLGNPSDGYYGKTISVSVKNFGAHITIWQSPELTIERQNEDSNSFSSIHSLVENIQSHGYYGGERLIKAAIKKFYEFCGQEGIPLENKNFSIRYHTSIPRQVGLAGSSAIITACIKALIRFYNAEIPKPLIPTLILRAEVEELGIKAGLQDRVIQVYEGCVYMDFEKEYFETHHHGEYEKLSLTAPPKFYIAYKTELSKVSGEVFNDVHRRYSEGDKHTIDTLIAIAECAREGREALLASNTKRLHELIDLNFDLRCKIMQISESNMEMVKAARACGASAKFAGSGGAIIGLYESDEMLTRLILELRKVNARVIKPYIF